MGGFDLYAYIHFILTENWTYHLHVARRTFSVVSCFVYFHAYLLKNMGSYCCALLVHLPQYVNITERDKMTTLIRSVICVIAHEEDIFHSFFIRGCLIDNRRRGVAAGKDVPPRFVSVHNRLTYPWWSPGMYIALTYTMSTKHRPEWFPKFSRLHNILVCCLPLHPSKVTSRTERFDIIKYAGKDLR